jgi:hypothetical protein
MRDILRTLYRGVLRLYPASFRGEFEEEMLWIFEEEARHGRVGALFLDAARSIVLQHVRPQAKATASNPYYVEIDSALPAQRLAQATLVIFYLACCLSILLAPWVSQVSRSAGNGWLLTHVRLVAFAPDQGPGKM